MQSAATLTIEINPRAPFAHKLRTQPGQVIQLLIDGVLWTGQKQINGQGLQLLRKGRQLEVQLEDQTVAVVDDFYATEEAATEPGSAHAMALSSSETQLLLQEGSALQVAAADLASVPTPTWGTLIAQAPVLPASSAAASTSTAASVSAVTTAASAGISSVILGALGVAAVAGAAGGKDNTAPVVTEINPATGTASMSGTAQEGGTLNAVTSGITDPDGTPLAFSYQWQMADTANGSYTNINGATASSYAIASDQSQVGKFLRVVVTATNDGTASGTSFVSAPSLAVANVNDAAFGQVGLQGIAVKGSTLIADWAIIDPDGTPLALSYQWQMADTADGTYVNLDGANSIDYIIANDQSQVGKFLRVVVTATNDGTPNGTSFTSSPSAQVVSSNNPATGSVKIIEGDLVVIGQPDTPFFEGGEVKADINGVHDPEGAILNFTYQWQIADTADGSYTNINGATSSNYHIASDQSQVGKFLRVVVTATNDGTANGTSFTSAPSLAVANVNDAPEPSNRYEPNSQIEWNQNEYIDLLFHLDFSDPDPGDQLTFSVSSGKLPTGTRLSEDGELQEPPTSAGIFNFTVRATDLLGLFWDIDYRIKIKDGEPPTFSDGEFYSVQVPENSTLIIPPPLVSDNVAVTRFEFSGGPDDDLFNLDPASGALSFIDVPDFENPLGDGSNFYVVRISALDAEGNFAEQEVTIEVTNVDPEPDSLTLAPLFAMTASASGQWMDALSHQPVL